MRYSSETIEVAIEKLASLPSIGKKTASRLIFHILKQPEQYSIDIARAIVNLKKNVRYCSQCFNYTETDPCHICNSTKRNRTVICVVEEPNDIIAIEKTNEFAGLYHVLHGTLSPLDGIGPEELKIKELIMRLAGIDEVILAINPSVEGEVTVQYLSKLIRPLNIKTTRIASGIPMGSTLEFTDEATLSRALEGRVTL